jgi:hypothetical protein
MRCLWATILVLPGALNYAEDQPRLVVHEWGVQVRSSVVVLNPISLFAVPKEDQKPRTVLGAPRELLDDLPAFVLRHAREYKPKVEHRAWDKPVIHLYGAAGLEVSVQVVTSRGHPTAYYPRPELLKETFWFMGSGLTEAVGMKWSGRLSLEAPAGKLADAGAGHWWGVARSVPSNYLSTAEGAERFIFYEATAVQEPTLTGSVQNDALTLRNAHATPSGKVIVILNDGAERHFLALDGVPGKSEVKVQKDELRKALGDEEGLLAACRAQWASFGLSAEEARAVVEIWKPDLLGKRGFLVCARLPAEVYEAMFPLTVAPKPSEVVRVGVVFDDLPGEMDRLAWLPGVQAEMAKRAKDLDHENFETRRGAEAWFAKLGDLATPFLLKLREGGSTEGRDAASRLLKALEPRPFPLPQHDGRTRPIHVQR